MSVEQDEGSAPPQDRSIRVVTHPDTKVTNCLVGYEGRAVGDHMIHRARIRNDQQRPAVESLGEMAVSRADTRPGERTISIGK